MLKSPLKLLVVMLIFFGTIELCARVDDAIRYGAPFWREYSADQLHLDDREGYRRNVPLASFEKWRNNRYGFRGPDFPQEKIPGVLRVVCLGSSETYGFHESPGKEWPAQLQALLPADRFQVINAAVVGTSLPSFGPYLEKRILPLRPDIVILVVPPLFYFNQGKEAPRGRPAQAKVPAQRPLAARVLANLRSLPKVKQVCKRALQNTFPERFRTRQLESLTRQVEEQELAKLAGRKPYDDIPQEYLLRFHDDLTAVVALLQGQGVKVVLTSYPSLLSVQNLPRFPEMFLGVRKFCIGLSCTGLTQGYQRFNAVSASVAAERGAPFVDCAGALPKTADYFGDGVHYTDLGARRISELLARALTGAAPAARELEPASRSGRGGGL